MGKYIVKQKDRIDERVDKGEQQQVGQYGKDKPTGGLIKKNK